MIKNTRTRFVGFFLFTAVLLSACVWPEKQNDPFERLPEEEIETLSGTIYPFSVSVSTRATHRLEKDNRLVSFLASDILRLDDFEGRKVEVDGVMRTEKMREIFWVEAIRLTEVPSLEELEPEKERFSTKSFSFVFPSGWEYSQSPSGTLYFTDKNDLSRRVFLTFDAKDMSSSDTNIDTNVLIANMAGTKKVSTDNADRERQEIILFSNVGTTKYKFTFTTPFEDFEKKQDFFQLLNSFIEGEENVTNAIEKDKKEQAALESKRLEILEVQELLENAVKTDDKDEEIGDESKKEDSVEDGQGNREVDKQGKEDIEETSKEEPGALTVPIEIGGDFENKVNEKAFYYESSHYQFSMSVPYGLWFKNFGPSDGVIARIGFADEEIASISNADFFLDIVSGTFNREDTESIEGNTLTILKERSDKTYYKLQGPADFRDYMWSVVTSVKTF